MIVILHTMYYLILLFFILLVDANINETSCTHTKIYDSRGSNSNKDNFYFVEETYNYGTLEKCSPMPDNGNNDAFKKHIEAILCTGKWCISSTRWKNGWNCPDSTNQCYHVEHIIPKANNIPELQGCNTNIFGNLVMAYGLWNQQLNNGFLCEKEEVYGSIYNQAYNAVLSCCDTPSPPSKVYISGIIVAVCSVIVFVILIVLFMVLFYSKRNYNNSEYTFENNRYA